MTTFSQILQGFKTVPTIKVSIKGSDAKFELTAPDAWLRQLTRERDRLIESGAMPKTNAAINKRVFVAKAHVEKDEPEGSEYFLGSPERDIDFFIDNVLCGWENICDNTGMAVPFSKATAKAYFVPNSPEVYKLVSRLFSEAANEENFANEEVSGAIKK